MKNCIFILLAIIMLASPVAAGDDEPQKYQVDFTLRYNAVDAETLSKILVYLEQLQKQVGSVKLKPCKWDVEVKKAEDGGILVSFGDGTWVIPTYNDLRGYVTTD